MRVWLDLKYVLRKPSGRYYYRRRIPDDLKGHHDGLSFFVQSLKTHEAAKAEAAAIRITQQLDTLWAYFRNPDDRSIPLTLRQRATAFLESHGFEPGQAKKSLGKIDHETSFTAIDLMLELYEGKLNEVSYGSKEETEETAIIREAVTQLSYGKAWPQSHPQRLFKNSLQHIAYLCHPFVSHLFRVNFFFGKLMFEGFFR